MTGIFEQPGSIQGTYSFEILLKGFIGMDEDRDFIYYYDKETLNNFQLSYQDLEKGDFSEYRAKIQPKCHIQFVIRQGKQVFLEFESENLIIKLNNETPEISIKMPVSYGILKKHARKKYHKEISRGSNQISWPEKQLFSDQKLRQQYSWKWSSQQNKLKQGHTVIADLSIKMK